MDLSTIADVQQLKAMGYDALAQIDQAQRNLAAINQRLSELSDTPADTTTPDE